MSGSGSLAFPVVVTAPSGTGKTTIARRVVASSRSLVFSVSATTRDPRQGEEDGTDYDFLSRLDFERMIHRGELSEWAEVHGQLYGTPARGLREAEDRGVHAVLDIDVQGALQVRESFPTAVLIFVFPPSAGDLLARLRGRGSEGSPEVRRRLKDARSELVEAHAFDYVIVNDDLDVAVEQVRRIVEVEGLSVQRSVGLPGEVDQMRQEIDEILDDGGALGPSGG